MSIGFSAARPSKGNLPGTPITTMQPAGTSGVTIVWEIVAGAKGAKDSDIAVVLLFDPTTRYVGSFTNAGRRIDGQARIILPENTCNKNLYGYLSFINEAVLAGKLKPENISDCCFCGMLEVEGNEK